MGQVMWLDALNQFGGVEAWYSDPHHGNRLAQYASACMIFTYLTGRDPRQNPFRDLARLWESPEDSPTKQVSEEAAVWIKQQVWLYYTTGRAGASRSPRTPHPGVSSPLIESSDSS